MLSLCGDFKKIFAFQAEGLLKLRRHQEADETMLKGPNFGADSCTKFLGPIGSAYVLVIRAQVDLAAGRLVFFTIEIKVLKCTHLDL